MHAMSKESWSGKTSPYACSYYPDDEEYSKEAGLEAEYQIKRLRDRTCLALWCGNNENLQMWVQKWGGPETAPARYFGESLYAKVLADSVRQLDPVHAYIESSPSTVPENSSGNGTGDQHFWEVWHGRGDWKYYSDSKGRFISEFGFASSCSLGQWQRTLSTGIDVSKDRPTVRSHDKTNKPFPTFSGFVDLHYPESQELKDWVYFSQLNQRDALRYGIEYFRRSDFCKGTLIWQFNDCWPVDSWAVQDYAGSLKPAAFELARLYAGAMLSIEETDAGVSVHCSEERPVQATIYSTRTAAVVQEISLTSQALDTSSFKKRETAIRFSIYGISESERWMLLSNPKTRCSRCQQLPRQISKEKWCSR